MALTTANFQKSIATGTWKPNIYLTNLAMAQFQSPDMFVATKLFPVVPVQLASSFYYKFSKADLARDDMQRKPMFGHVAPTTLGQTDETYNCKVDQIIIGIDQLSAENYTRTGAPGVADPRQAKVRAATEKVNIHLDTMFANSFFKKGVWTNECEGVASSPTDGQFIQFSNDSSDPVQFIDEQKTKIIREGRRIPNKLALGVDTFTALKHNPSILDRIKYSGSTANPATVNENVLAQLFGVDQVVVLYSTYNKAGVGEEEQMDFACDPKGALLCYAPDTPMIDEPSAGYTFAWDVLGGGNYIAMTQYEGYKADHAEFIEGIMAYDMKKTGDDLAVYFDKAVA